MLNTKPEPRPAADNAVAEALAEVDRLAAEHRTLTAASDRGRAQLAEVGRELEAIRLDGPDGQAAAGALLRGEAVGADAADTRRLAAQKQALRTGLAELARQLTENERRTADGQQKLRTALIPSLDRASDDLRRRAEKTLSELAEVYAGAMALKAAGHGRAGLLAWALEPGLFKGAVEGVIKHRDIQVPAEVIEALPDERLVTAAGGRIIRSVALPNNP